MEPIDINYMGCREPAPAVHLGDGAYALFDGYQLVLRAHSHEVQHCSGQVALEPGAFMNLLRYAQTIWRFETPTPPS